MAALTWAGDFRVVRSNGAAFLVNFRNYVDRQIAFHGDYEAAQHDYFLGEMDRRRCDVFIDVGANIGLYSVLVARRPQPPRIVAFEPDPRNYDQFRANLQPTIMGLPTTAVAVLAVVTLVVVGVLIALLSK